MGRLKADVRLQTGMTVHSAATSHGVERCETPVWVEIVQQDDAFYLLRKNAYGESIADTWHLTLEEAKEQAAFEYGIIERDWLETPEP